MAKQSTKTSPALQAFMTQLEGLSLNEILYAISETNKENQEALSGFVSEQVAADLQYHVDSITDNLCCPSCGAANYKKDGKRKNVQRYQCRECGHKFTSMTGTVLEKSHYTWSAWVKAVYCLINGHSLAKTQQTLVDDLKCIKIDEKTVWKMCFKIMHAIASLPSPTLTGVVQIDDTFFRENQKGAVELYNPLPEDFGIPREPRKGLQPTRYGVRGNEFATATTMIDERGYLAIDVLGTGTLDQDDVEKFIESRTEDVSFFCSDADKTYRKVFRKMKTPHYVKPSKYLSTITKAGYEQPSRRDDNLAAMQREHDNKVLRRLYEAGKIDRIHNMGKLNWDAFCEIKYRNRLNLGRVNEVHADMKEFIYGETKGGVATKYLPYYLSLFQYLHNKRIDSGKTRFMTSMADAEEILIEIVKARVNITEDEMKEISSNPATLQIHAASNQYMRNLAAKTERAREITGDPKFRFGKTDGAENFQLRQTLRDMGIGDIKEIAKMVKLPGRSRYRKSELVECLCKMGQPVEDAVLKIQIGHGSIDGTVLNAKGKTDTQFDDGGYDHYDHNPVNYADVLRISHKHTFAPRLFTTIEEALACNVADDKIVFFDTETTGLAKTDEVLTLGVVDKAGEVLYDQMFMPLIRRFWKPEVAAVHHIEFKHTVGCPSIKDEKDNIEAVFNNAEIIVGWNSKRFDMPKLYTDWVDLPQRNETYIDLMEDFGRIHHELYGGKKSYTLEEASDIVGVKYDAHEAVADSAVLIAIWNWLEERLADKGKRQAA